MERTTILSLILLPVFCSSTMGSSNFHHINVTKTYEEAKLYCREKFTDLATVHSSVDMENLISLVPNTTERAWIGMEAGNEITWHWSLPDQQTNYFNWKAGEPRETAEKNCTAMDPSGNWSSDRCATAKQFVCQDNGKASNYSLFTSPKSWRDAQTHCRTLSSDLVTINSAEENDAVRRVLKSQQVWIGLFGDNWKWSDGSNSSFRFWRANKPNNLDTQLCVAVIFLDEGRWNNRHCNTKFPFICHDAQELISPTTSVETEQESTTVHRLPTPFPHNSSETNITTPGPATATKTISTQSASHPSSTELSEITIEMQTSTGKPPNPTATTLMPTVNTKSLHPGDLILIQENMTWIGAMSYCRENHIDLVHISTEYIQDKVAEQARNATSRHVWLGLRYTCTLKHWVWIGSNSNCYQNWAPEHGPGKVNDCGFSGAIEATGRQQWVSMPETEELNFICYTSAR